jgi:hypothetical protein
MKNLRSTIYDLRAAFLALLFLVTCHSSLGTPFYLQGFLSTNPALTNQCGVSAWPPSDSPFTIYGTNIIYCGNILTITPNNSGYASNWLYPGTYRFYFTNLNAAFVAVIPDTTNFISLAQCVTNAQIFSGIGLNSFGLITNWLGYTPAPNTYAGISNSVGFVLATNGGTVFYSQLPYAPPTNSYSGISNVVGFVLATNGGAVSYSQLPYTAATNSYNGLTNVLGFKPRTNDGYTGLSALSGVANIVTNGFICWVSYQTNANPGAQFTNLPMGSVCSTTNGQLFVLSNLTWNLK